MNHKQAETQAAKQPAAEQLKHATEAAEQLDETNTCATRNMHISFFRRATDVVISIRRRLYMHPL